jgi:tetratricopeptide (TPR) repeat protein
VGQYLICHLELAKQAIEKEDLSLALSLLEQAETYPPNLGEGKLTRAQENDMHYWKGVVSEMMNDRQKANDYYRQATLGISEPVQTIFYNDPQPDKIFYQGLAWMKLNDQHKAYERFQSLIGFGENHMEDKISIDYFAVSLPDMLVFDVDLDLLNRIHSLYLAALGSLGLGNVQEAVELFDKILALDTNHQGALAHKKMSGKLSLIEQ